MSSPKMPYLDGWRGLAILSVLVSHFVGGGSWLGLFGVQLFFALSGYFMSDLLFIRREPLTTFFVRRFSRVMPAFWLFVAAMVAYSVLLQPERYVPGFDEVIAVLTFLRTYYPTDVSIWTTQWPIGHIWSLNVEEHSYLFLAAGAVVLRKMRKNAWAAALLLASVVASLAFNWYYAKHPPATGSHWSLYSQCAAYGLLGAAAYRVLREHVRLEIIERHGGALSVACLVAAVLLSVPWSPVLKASAAMILMAISVNHVHQVAPTLRRALEWKPLTWLGTISYSLYLWQQPFFLLRDHGVNSLLCAAGALAMGALSFYFFENPLRGRINRAWAQRRRPSVLPADTRPTS